MHDLEYALKTFSYSIIDPADSFSTRADRRKMLRLLARQLVALGYKHLDYRQLKGRHVHALLRLWQSQALSTGTVKNRMAVLRWWAYHVGKPGLVPNANEALGIPKRTYIPETSKAQTLAETQLATITDPYVAMSLRLQAAFGLRREESMKIKVWQADKGEWLVLQDSWCKGGRPRVIPVRTATQRAVLEEAKALVGHRTASLIPPHKQYVEQLHTYEGQLRRAGIHQAHGLRHAYAQARYEALAGLPAPINRCEGQTVLQEDDHAARLIVAEELGHSRRSITTTYIGSSRKKASTLPPEQV